MSGIFSGIPIGSVVGQIWGPKGDLVTLTYGSISTAASGDTTLVAAQSGKSIYLVGLVLVSAGTVSVKFRSNTTDITGAMSLAANSVVVLPNSPLGYTKTTAGELFAINLSGAVQVSGSYVVAIV